MSNKLVYSKVFTYLRLAILELICVYINSLPGSECIAKPWEVGSGLTRLIKFVLDDHAENRIDIRSCMI